MARHPDYRDAVVEVVIESGTNEVDLKLQPGWEISGTVTTAAGAPVPFARVEAHPVELPVSLDGLADARRQLVPGGPLEAVTDQDGSYRIGGLDDGRYRLRTHADGYARAASGRFPVRVEGRSVAGIDIVLHQGITLRGVVKGRPPDAFAGIRITAAQERLLGGMTTPDLEGRFQLDELGPGTCTVSAEERDGRTVERSLTLETGPGEAFVELNFEPGLTLTGEVRSQGQPLAGANLIAIVVDPEAELAPGAEEEWTPAGYTQSNAHGEYRLQFAPGASTSLMVQREGYEGFGLPLDLVPGERRGGFMIELQPE